MNVLIACEESQIVCKEFLTKGHNAFSCDIMKPSGDRPDRHIHGDVTPLINGNCTFQTMDGTWHNIPGSWDLIIAHPPCTYLTTTGNRWYTPKYANRFPDRIKNREKAISFFKMFYYSNAKRIAIENPIGIMSTVLCPPFSNHSPVLFRRV